MALSLGQMDALVLAAYQLKKTALEIQVDLKAVIVFLKIMGN